VAPLGSLQLELPFYVVAVGYLEDTVCECCLPLLYYSDLLEALQYASVVESEAR